MLVRLSSALFVTTLLAACGDAPSSSPEDAQAPAPGQIAEQTETDRLNVWLDEQYEQQLDFSPQTRSVLGDKTDYDQLNDVTPEAQQRRLDWQRQSVATMRSEFEYQALNEDGKLSFDMWEYALEQAEAAYPYRNYGYIFGRGGPHASLPSFMISFHRVDDEPDLKPICPVCSRLIGCLVTCLTSARSRQLQASVSHALTMSLHWKKSVG